MKIKKGPCHIKIKIPTKIAGTLVYCKNDLVAIMAQGVIKEIKENAVIFDNYRSNKTEEILIKDIYNIIPCTYEELKIIFD